MSYKTHLLDYAYVTKYEILDFEIKSCVIKKLISKF